MIRIRGFTLIELLVAMAIVAIIGVMAFVGLNQVLDQQQIARERAERWREVQLAMRVVLQDLAQLHPRPTRDELGEIFQPSLLTNTTAGYALEFSRGGWSNPAGLARGTVARIAYDWEDDTLVRYLWPVVDRTLATIPVRTELLSGVENIEVEFMDAGGNWHIDWPPGGLQDPSQYVSRPRAIDFQLELEDYGQISRIVEISG